MKLTKAQKLIIATFVLLMHLVLLLIVTRVTDGEEKKKNKKNKPVPVLLISRHVQFVPKEDKMADPRAPRTNCPTTYRGIGLKRTWDGRVFEIAKGWPADRAGIRLGDVIEVWDLGREGDYMVFDLVRDGKTLHFRIKMEDICEGPK
jgi:C-terminal processing protease CtpA/Prc